jgi:hypothetical protein
MAKSVCLREWEGDFGAKTAGELGIKPEGLWGGEGDSIHPVRSLKSPGCGNYSLCFFIGCYLFFSPLSTTVDC